MQRSTKTRWWQNVAYPRALALRAFPHGARRAIAQAVRDAEQRHGGQIRVVVEPALDMHHLWRGVSPRQRAVGLFASTRVWDTAHHDGVLVYLLLAERAVEIVADRGLADKVSPAEWQQACDVMRDLLRRRRPMDAVLAGIAGVDALRAAHVPEPSGGPAPRRVNELPDWPLILWR